MPRTKQELEKRLKELEREIVSLRADMQAIAKKGRNVVIRGKDARDRTLMNDIRKKLGL